MLHLQSYQIPVPPSPALIFQYLCMSYQIPVPPSPSLIFQYLCMSVCSALSVLLTLSLSLSLYLCLCLYLCLSLCVSLSVSVSLSLCLSFCMVTLPSRHTHFGKLLEELCNGQLLFNAPIVLSSTPILTNLTLTVIKKNFLLLVWVSWKSESTVALLMSGLMGLKMVCPGVNV